MPRSKAVVQGLFIGLFTLAASLALAGATQAGPASAGAFDGRLDSAAGVEGSASDPSLRAGGATTPTVYLPLVLYNYPLTVVTIMQENFEGSFPGAHWNIFEQGAGDYRWAARTCAAHSGAHSAWAVGGGANGGSLACGANYPPNADSWMRYGPFDLSDATLALLSYQYSVNTVPGGARLCSAVSGDNFLYLSSLCHDGDHPGWNEATLDLDTVAQFTGNDSVWVALFFRSDASASLPTGALVDDLLLRKCVVAFCPGFAPASAGSEP